MTERAWLGIDCGTQSTKAIVISEDGQRRLALGRAQTTGERLGEALVAATERLAQEPMDLSRPLWDMCVLPGLPDGRLGLFVRMHHAIADGMAAMTNIAVLLDSDPDATSRPPAP